jgi:DNA end-binding protein Ku
MTTVRSESAMAARSAWKGYLRVNLVSIPVKAYTGTASGSDGIRLNQLHAACNSRIQYKKACPVHGEVPSDEIVSGYEYAKGQYVIVDPNELEKLRTEDDKAITVDAFVQPSAIEPIYLNGKTHYLVPDGPIGQKPYTVLLDAMKAEDRYAVARIVMHGKEQLVLLRPVGNLIAMMGLDYEFQVTKPTTFEEEAPKAAYVADELKLMKTLIDASSPTDFDLGKYKDVYTERLTKLIEAKVAGQEIVAPPIHEQAQIINLMDALKQSLALRGKKEEKPVAAKKPPKKVAPSAPPAKVAKERKRKIS